MRYVRCPLVAILCLLTIPHLGRAAFSAEEPPGAPAGCGAESSVPSDVPALKTVWIPRIPHIPQQTDFCGEACAAMYLRAVGSQMTQDDVFVMSGLNPMEARGCYTLELNRALRRIGFETGNVWRTIDTADSSRGLSLAFQELHADLLQGWPSIVCTRYDEQPETTEHFRLVVGYDHKTDEVLYHEPAVENGAYRRMARRNFLELWPLKYSDTRWTLIRMKLVPGRLMRPRKQGKFSAAEYCQHLIALKKKVPEGFSIVLEKPFFVIGDEDEARVRQWATGTVRWTIDHLKRSYFEEDPEEILDIWLFKDKESYERGTQEIFGDTPNTPFGYYSHPHRSLIMNIATGGGTLVHEMVHPFMATNFPSCPAWFNEGLASLYEQSSERNGQIVGLTNWRLEGLQKSIQSDEKQLPSFEQLCTTTTREFYLDDPGTNYAQARYLVYYLQQRRLLRSFYRQFRAAAGDDPGGYRTLQRLLGVTDMKQFQQTWEEWVLTLRFP
jgi:hypothetical protein